MSPSAPKASRGAAALRVVIVDDEPLARDCVRLALATDPDVDVVAECADGQGAVKAIGTLKPDLVFLDVQMPGLDGFGVIEKVGLERMPAVIFVTAYDVHALRAFEVHALDYVLKPFDDARFRTVLAHARERLSADEARQMAGRLAALLADRRFAALPDAAVERRSTEGTATRFTVRRDDRIRFVKAQDVDWIEAAGNYIRLHVGDEVHQLRATLASTLEQLDPRTFVRIHRSVIVNVERIREVQPWFGGDYVAILRNGRQLRVSRHYRDDLLRPSA